MHRTIIRVLLAVLAVTLWPCAGAYGQIVDKVGKEEIKVNSDSVREALTRAPISDSTRTTISYSVRP